MSVIAKWLFLDQSDIFIVDKGASADESADLKGPSSTGFRLLYFASPLYLSVLSQLFHLQGTERLEQSESDLLDRLTVIRDPSCPQDHTLPTAYPLQRRTEHMFTTFSRSMDSQGSADTASATKAGPTGRPKRSQVARACDSCRLNRIKCDNHQPCRNCQNKGNPCSNSRFKDAVRTLPEANA